LKVAANFIQNFDCRVDNAWTNAIAFDDRDGLCVHKYPSWWIWLEKTVGTWAVMASNLSGDPDENGVTIAFFVIRYQNGGDVPL
jgi:hypothetical protein